MKKIILILLTLLTSLLAQAQNNSYKIDDEVYDILLEAIKLRGTEPCLEVADRGVKLAVRKGDLKGECVMKTAITRHYYVLEDYDNLLLACEDLRKTSIKNGYMQYYYYAYQMQVNLLLNQRQYAKAMEIADRMREESEQSQDNYGIYTSMRTIYNIYHISNDVKGSIDYAKKVVDFFWEHEDLHDQSIAPVYRFIGDAYARERQRDTSLFYLDLAEKNSKSFEDTTGLALSRTLLYCYVEDKDAFYREYEKLKAMETFAVTSSYPKMIMIKDAAYRGDKEEALRLADIGTNKLDILTRRKDVFLAFNDYEGAYNALNEIKSYTDSLHNTTMNEVIADYVSRLGVSTVRIEAQKKQSRMLIAIIVLSTIILALLLMSLYFARRSMRKLAAKNDELHRASEMKTKFVQNMSHEVRTPLNAIMGFSQLMALPSDFVSDEERNEYSEYIKDNSEMLMMIVNDILDLSDVDRGNFRIELADASCNQICRQAMNSVRCRIPINVDFRFETDVDENFKLHTDPKRVAQVLLNYLTNACKHTTEGEIVVSVSTTERPGKVVFAVRDTGTGVPPEQAENIFQRFTKLDDFVQGTGLGLNICRTIAEKLGAEVSLDTSYTSGARFLFVI